MNPTQPASALASKDLSAFLTPRSIAIIGASNDLTRIGGQPIKLLADFGFAGKVYPVNPKYEQINGLTCYPDVASLPKPCDVALIALSGSQVPAILEQCGQAGILSVIVLSAGFGEVGGEGLQLQQKLKAICDQYHIRLNGPNCLGIANLTNGFRAGFGGTLQMKTLKSGPVAMVTQSGGFGFGIVSTASDYGLGFNYVISTGNEDNLTTLDWVEHLIERPEVRIVTIFLEGTTEGRRLIEIGQRAMALDKPLLILKVGNTAAGSQAMTSHTARLTAGPELFRAAFAQGGYIEVRDIDDLVDVSKAILSGKKPKGRRVGVITMSGGAGVLLADRCVEAGLSLPQFTEETTAGLRSVMVPYASANNPVDATANGYNDHFASYSKAVKIMLADPNVDAAIARAPRGKSAKPWAEGLVHMLKDSDKPVVINWGTSPNDNTDVLEYLEANGIPCLLTPGRTAHALATLANYTQRKKDYALRSPHGLKRTLAKPNLPIPQCSGALGEHASKKLLAPYGIPAVAELLLTLQQVDALTSAPLAWPVAVKIESADIPHKTEAGVVRLGVDSLETLKKCAHELKTNALKYRPDAKIDGILIQSMASGLEVIVGAINDPYFGPVVTFGLGGILTELMHDVSHRFAPFDTQTAKQMILEIKASALLLGYRGKPALDVDALAEVLSRVSWMMTDYADRISELDINPLFVKPAGQGVVAADALLVLK
ncbi:MAG: acetate--CoA ligase family protein [Betaproteobacteria bacterium]